MNHELSMVDRDMRGFDVCVGACGVGVRLGYSISL